MPSFNKFLCAAAAMPLAVGAPAGAQAPLSLSDADNRDAACILAVAAAAEQIAETQEVSVEFVQAMSTYFAGKIKGRHPGIKLADVLTPAYVEKLAVDATTLVRCGTELQEVGQDMTVAGQALMAHDPRRAGGEPRP